MSKGGDRAENLEQAIACYQEALKVYTFEAFPVDWAMTQHNLGFAYHDRIRGDRAENLEQAIACYQEALKVYTFEAFPVDWAMTQNNLGNVYSDRIRGDRAENLEQAIACYQEALKVRTFEAFPVDWAMTQNNLGNVYSDRIRGDQGENLERALACHREALKVRTFDAFPQQWAMTQHNLGFAYRNRIRGDRAENLEQAIACYREALKVYTFEAFPVDWAMTQHNLGFAYSERIRGDKAENLGWGISACRQWLIPPYKSLNRKVIQKIPPIQEIPYYTDISCPRQIWEKTPRISAVVRLKINPPEYSDAPVEELPVRFVKEKLSEEDEQLRLESPVRVRVDAPAFIVLNEPEQEVVIQPGADSFPLVFDLQPLPQIGHTRINFDFFQGGNPLGTASLSVEITPTEVSSKLEASLKSQLRSQINAQRPDLILYVKYEPSPNQPLALRFTLFRDGGLGRDFLPVDLNGDPQSYTANLYRGLENLTRAVAGRMVAKEDRQQGVRLGDIDRGLQKLGYRLWNDLIPKEFKELYAEHRESWHGKTLLLLSDEPYIPWELVWPYDGGNQWQDEAPWCVTMQLTRWLRRDDQGNGHEMAPSLLHLNKLACIAPEQAKLEYALQERQFLQEQISRHHLQDVSPAACRLLEIEELLESSEYDWLHIATHGDFDTDTPDDSSAILLDNNEKLTVNDLLGPQIQAHIHNSRPAFFFNACHSGRQAWALTGLGGWPNRLVSAGAGLFLAPLWKVSDDLALEFAKTFYEQLLRGNTVAEAMRSARNKARREGDPTWLAYSVYAHPNASLHKASILEVHD